MTRLGRDTPPPGEKVLMTPHPITRGWRGLFLVGLVPLVLVFVIRYRVPQNDTFAGPVSGHGDRGRSAPLLV
jgi:hypothetical protein